MSRVLLSMLQALFPQLPAWAIPLLLGIFDAAFESVEALDEVKGLSGAEKLRRAAEVVKKLLDTALDEVPVFSALTEEQRDAAIGRIVDGIVELVLMIKRSPATGGAADRRTARSLRERLHAKGDELGLLLQGLRGGAHDAA